jgi:hypothetical protein
MTAGALARYDAACRAIADVKSGDEILLIHDQAHAIEAAARVAKNRDLEADWSLDERVITMTPDACHIAKDGPWITMLASVRKMLDSRFGPPLIEQPAPERPPR